MSTSTPQYTEPVQTRALSTLAASALARKGQGEDPAAQPVIVGWEPESAGTKKSKNEKRNGRITRTETARGEEKRKGKVKEKVEGKGKEKDNDRGKPPFRSVSAAASFRSLKDTNTNTLGISNDNIRRSTKRTSPTRLQSALPGHQLSAINKILGSSGSSSAAHGPSHLRTALPPPADVPQGRSRSRSKSQTRIPIPGSMGLAQPTERSKSPAPVASTSRHVQPSQSFDPLPYHPRFQPQHQFSQNTKQKPKSRPMSRGLAAQIAHYGVVLEASRAVIRITNEYVEGQNRQRNGEKIEMSCAVFGSLASKLYGCGRFPKDVDMLISQTRPPSASSSSQAPSPTITYPSPSSSSASSTLLSAHDIKLLILQASPRHFYLKMPKDPNAGYQILWYRRYESPEDYPDSVWSMVEDKGGKGKETEMETERGKAKDDENVGTVTGKQNEEIQTRESKKAKQLKRLASIYECKVDILVPGPMDLPYVPAEKVVWRPTKSNAKHNKSGNMVLPGYTQSQKTRRMLEQNHFPLVPYNMQVFQKLQGWDDHVHASPEEPWKRAKAAQDAADVRRLMECEGMLGMLRDTKMGGLTDASLFNPTFQLLTQARVVRFCKAVGSATGASKGKKKAIAIVDAVTESKGEEQSTQKSAENDDSKRSLWIKLGFDVDGPIEVPVGMEGVRVDENGEVLRADLDRGVATDIDEADPEEEVEEEG